MNHNHNWLAVFFSLLLLTLTSKAHAELDLQLDLASRFQDIKAEPVSGVPQGNDPVAESGFQDVVGNIHVQTGLHQSWSTYTQLWLLPTNRVTSHEIYIRSNRFLDPLDLKIGQFEVDYGWQKTLRSDLGDVQTNPLVGNTLLDPMGAQLGIELSGTTRGVEWIFSVTNGNDTALYDPDNGPALTLNVSDWITTRTKLRGSFYHVDSSADSSTVSHPSNLFAESTQWTSYNLPTNSTWANFGNGGEVLAWQLDFLYDHVLFDNRLWYGQLEEEVDLTGGGTTFEADYYGSEVTVDLTDSTYFASRFERIDDQMDDLGGEDDVERYQYGLGTQLKRHTLFKIEWVEQTAENYRNGSPRSALSIWPQNFDGFISEMSVNF